MKKYFNYIKAIICLQLVLSCSAQEEDYNSFNDFIKSFIFYKCSKDNLEVSYELTNVQNINIIQSASNLNTKTIIYEKCTFKDDKISFVTRKSESNLSNNRYFSFKDIMNRKFILTDNIKIEIFKDASHNEKILELYSHDLFEKIYEEYYDMYINIDSNCNYDYYASINNEEIKECNLQSTHDNFLHKSSPEYRLVQAFLTSFNAGLVDETNYLVKSFLQKEIFLTDGEIEIFKENPCVCENENIGFWSNIEFSF